jgi:hypothetical protein
MISALWLLAAPADAAPQARRDEAQSAFMT